MNQRKFFTNNQLKLIALVAMTFDHIGAYLFPAVMWLRVIGRFALPIFAYMIAEGCRYTKNKRQYLLILGGTAVAFQIVAFFMNGTLKQYILVTFFLSAILCFSWNGLLENKNAKSLVLFFVCGVFVLFVTRVLPVILKPWRFSVDYGIYGVALPVAVFIMPTKWSKLAGLACAMLVLSAHYGGVQWYSFLALLLLALYNGKRGSAKLKYLFYLYFPLHLIVIWTLANFL